MYAASEQILSYSLSCGVEVSIRNFVDMKIKSRSTVKMSSLLAKCFTIFLMLSFNSIFVETLRTSALNIAIISLGILSNVHPGIASFLFRAPISTLLNEFLNVSKLEDDCTTWSCNNTASAMLEKMDFNVDPCDNFYRFACGTFQNSTIIPDDKAEVNIFSLVSHEVKQKLRVIMEESSQPGKLKSSKIVKDLYKICMDEDKIEKQGLDPLHEILENLGGWPVIAGSKWNEDEFNWINMTYTLIRLGYKADYLMKISLELDPRNNSRYSLSLDQGSMSTFHDSSTWIFYLNYILKIAIIVGEVPETQKSNVLKELMNSWNFEKKLFKISIPIEQRTNHSLYNNLMTISDLNKNYPSIPWREYFNQFLPSDIQIDDTETVKIKVPKFIENLENLLKTTSKRRVANYMMWNVVKTSLPYLNKKIRHERTSFLSLFSGMQKSLPRWEECVQIVVDHVSVAVDALYIHKHVDHKMKEKTEGMIREIGRQFKKILQNISWIDDYTRKNALEKLESMSSLIAFPDVLLKNDELEKFYGRVEISTSNLLFSCLNVTSFTHRIEIGELRSYFDKETIVFKVAAVNAYYSPSLNTLLFPAGILQGFFFNSERPMYVNFGAIGSLIGHEITHGFDNQGRQHDKGGNVIDWWHPITAEKFLQKLQCVINQYGNYTADEVGINLDGSLTQGENIADLGGIKMAYLAYKDWSKRNGPEPKLPGLNYTAAQMYWISTASLWCSKERPFTLINKLLGDTHSPSEFRIIGSFSNIPEFSEDFNCPLGSKMNPDEKCDLW